MIKTKIKKIRFLIGSVLAMAFSVHFLLVGIGSFFISSASAELLDKQIPNSFTYSTNTLNNFRALNVASFLGKPVKIPFASVNPDGVPGEDQDYAIIYPPRVLDKNASVPLRAIYLSSGKEITSENAQFVQNIEKFVNSVGDNNPVMLEIVKNLIQSNLKVSINTDSCRNIACYVPMLLKIARADTTDSTNTSPLLTSDDISQLTNSLGSMDTTNPQVKQLLTLVLILIMVNQSMANSLNSDKQACLDMGGNWSNGTCNSEQKSACENNGGTFRKFTNQCLSDKQICGNDDLQCNSQDNNSSSYLNNANDNQDSSVYGCACKTGSCLNDQGTCIPKDNGKKKVCENSGGTWRSFFDTSELCTQGCDATAQSACSSTASASSSSSQGLMGCDCSSANGNSNSSSKWTQGSSNAGACLSSAGSCIAKDTSNADDDNDGVKNAQDRCPNSSPDGSGTVNMQAGSQYAGCTCSQIQAMGGIQKQQQQQCPPDGCEQGTQYMVQYDRSQQQNNQNPLCQNGIVQQQQQQQYIGQNGTSTTCPVIARVPDDRCANQNQNQNDNMNKKLDDLLKQLKDQDKKNQDQGKNNQGNNQGNNGNPNNGNQQQPQPKPDDQTKPPAPGAVSAAVDPKGVGAYNAKQDGTAGHPYALHVSQFTKVCGENIYVLTNATPSEGKFKDDPSKANVVTPGNVPLNNLHSALNQLTNCSPTGGCPVDRGNLQAAAGQAYNQMKDKFTKLDQTQQSNIISILTGGGDPKDKLNKAATAVNEASNSNNQKIQTPVQSNGKAAKTMQDLNEPGAYFKVPKCEELAAAFCCVCSCCDKSKKDCGWSIGKTCKDGKCQGPNCDAESCSKCSEDPAKSIQLVMGGSNIPAKLTQADNKCYEINHDKEATASKLSENYSEAMHVGQCRYDGKGQTKGCEDNPQGNGCKIIIKGQEIQRFNEDGSTVMLNPTGDAKKIIFANQKDGSIVQTIGGKQPSETDWIKNLEKSAGKVCRCKADDSEENPNQQYPNGYVPPSGTTATPPQPDQQTPTEQPYGDLNGAGQQPVQLKPGDKVPTLTGEIPKDKIDELKNSNAQFNNYYNDKNRADKPTWEDWNDYQNYNKWLNSGSFFDLPGKAFYHLMGWDTFGEYKKHKSTYSAYIK